MGVGRLDGISDQSLPAWDGSFASSTLTAMLRMSDAVGQGGQIELARYVVQWNVASEPSRGPNAWGDYRERFEAWLTDVRDLGLTAVVAPTSYDGGHPASTGSYTPALQAILALALGAGEPIAYLEPWNEPNGQGRATATSAAELANAANAVCVSERGCTVIAGDLQDTTGFLAYERRYERALTFAPSAWGIHPYVSVAAHDDTAVRSFAAGLPARGAGAELWITEIAGLYCRRGTVLGQARQARDVSYLVDGLLRDPAVAPAHAIYYGLAGGAGRSVPCTRSGGEDSELFGPGDQARAAAAVAFPTLAGDGSPLFGPSPAGGSAGL
jgi:hypothetical protein